MDKARASKKKQLAPEHKERLRAAMWMLMEYLFNTPDADKQHLIEKPGVQKRPDVDSTLTLSDDDSVQPENSADAQEHPEHSAGLSDAQNELE